MKAGTPQPELPESEAQLHNPLAGVIQGKLLNLETFGFFSSVK